MLMMFEKLKDGTILTAKSSQGFWYFKITKKTRALVFYNLISFISNDNGDKYIFIPKEDNKSEEEWNSNNFVGKETKEISREEFFDDVFKLSSKFNKIKRR